MNQLCEIINDVFDELEGVSWSSKRYHEYGFYERNKKKEVRIIFWIWYASWEHFEIPVCLAVEYSGKAPEQWGVTPKTAWFVNLCIREMLKDSNPTKFENVVQFDEKTIIRKKL